LTPETQAGPADKEEVWTIGSKFKPTLNGSNEELPSKFTSHRAKGDMGPTKESAFDEIDWRSTARTQKISARSNVSRRFNYKYLFMTLTFQQLVIQLLQPHS
jgi:translation initiation factor 4B